MYRHILIPTDGSELAHKAVVEGLSLSKSLGAKVTVITVIASFNIYDVMNASRANQTPVAFEEYAKNASAQAELMLNRIAEDAKAAGVQCETLQIIHDHPYEAIVAAAKEKGCELIVMASHGRGGIAAIVLGSVTAKVLTHTAIPVLVYR
jgi:nucleotide-binding universal stress UspA family protein